MTNLVRLATTIVASVALNAPVHAGEHHGSAVDVEVQAAFAREPFEDYPASSTGLSFGAAIGTFVTERVAIQTRMRIAAHRRQYGEWFAASIGPSVTIAFDGFTMSGTVAGYAGGGDTAHCFPHPKGAGFEVAGTVVVPFSQRLGFAASVASSTVFDDSAHTDVTLLLGARVSWY
jgi:hypothetical protein